MGINTVRLMLRPIFREHSFSLLSFSNHPPSKQVKSKGQHQLSPSKLWIRPRGTGQASEQFRSNTIGMTERRCKVLSYPGNFPFAKRKHKNWACCLKILPVKANSITLPYSRAIRSVLQKCRHSLNGSNALL